MSKQIVIANCGGFWGDDPTAAARQVQGGPIDYLVMDYLAEVTMAILHKQMARRPELGYAGDFLTQLRDVLVDCVDNDITIISNAGGVNPHGCRLAVEALAAELGVADKVRVGVVTGDDIYPELDDILASEPLNHMETGEPLSGIRDQVMSANAYLGADPIVKALEMGANIVICGRVTDTGVTLAPMVYEFGWAADDWDRIAAGIVGGHIIECGLQACGGNFTDWQLVPSHENMGYPLLEVESDGTFVVTKHPDTGGLVSVHTVGEQLLYEMGSPAYLAPDCVAHFDSIQLSNDGPNRVRVEGVKGSPPPPTLKVSVSFQNGYRAFGRLLISGPDTLAKARKLEEVFWSSVGGRDNFDDARSQLIGWDGTHPPLTIREPSEVILQVAVRDADRDKIDKLFAPQVVPKVLGTIPGVTVLADQGRPRASDVVGYWPALLSRGAVKTQVQVGDNVVDVVLPQFSSDAGAGVDSPEVNVEFEPTGETATVPLSRLALGRSGDKGDTSNVGLIARSPAIYGWLVETITEDFVKERFAGIARGGVDRFELPNLISLNFLIHESLGGGGTMSLLADAQGKSYAQYLLATEVAVDSGLLV